MADPIPAGDGLLAVLNDKLVALQRQLTEVAVASGTQRALTARRTPLQDFQIGQASGFAVTSGWVTYASVTLVVPDGRTRLQMLAIGTAAVLDKTSGGATSSLGRIVIGSVTSREFPAAKDAGASMVNNVITATSGGDIDVTGQSSIPVLFQLRPLNPAAFPADPQNFAQLAVDASFTIA